jgi:hypothetical protein
MRCVLGGIHFRFAERAAARVGYRIARRTVATQMTPTCRRR